MPPHACFAVTIFALFMMFLGWGRINNITESDIAKQELRSLGIQFSINSPQNAIYFFDCRAIKLFRLAGVSTADIYRALGQPHELTGQDPLLLGIF